MIITIIHDQRGQAAIDLVNIEKNSDAVAIETAKKNTLKPTKAFNDSRKKAVEFIKTTNENRVLMM